MSSTTGNSSCKTSSGICAFCGEYLGNSSIPIVAYGSPSSEGKGAFTKLKPLRWRFLTNKAPRTKYMCAACAEKRQVPQPNDQQPVGLDSSWSHGAKDPESFQKRLERSSKLQQPPDQALKLEHLQEPRDKVRRAQDRHQQREKLQQKREKLQQEHRERQNAAQQQPRSDGRRRGPSQTSPRSSRGSMPHPFSNHRVSRDPILRNRPVSAAEIGTRNSVLKPRAASVATLGRPRKPSNGQPEPRGSEKKDSQTDQRLSSTADILGMSRSLDLPPNYFAMSTMSPTFTVASAPDQDPLSLEHLEMQLPPQMEPQRQNETEEERQRRRSASYAHMLLRMRRHYDTVQVNGAQAPVTAPPRRVRADRRAKSVAVRNVKHDPVNFSPAGLAVDLAYLRAYKDAR
ncbi:hypothetical protein PRNP1_010027 [Phytophthora ramorum]